MRPMRRAHQQVVDITTLERWLNEALVGRLATIDENGYPVIKPVNFVFAEGKIFFHSAPQGEKLDDICRDARVGFEVDKVFAITPAPERGCQTHCFYESVLIRGRARILNQEHDQAAKENALRLLVKKYSPEMAESALTDVHQTSVVEITIEHITGKEDFGQKWSPQRKLLVARLLLERDGVGAADAILRMGLTLEDFAELRKAEQ